VRDSEVSITGFGGWGAGRMGLDLDLIESIKKGHVAIIHAFLAKGADVNAKDQNGGPALLWAAGGGHPDIVQLLLDHGADKRISDRGGKTALDIARKKNRQDIEKLLS